MGVKARDVLERLWSKTEPIPECGCYVWTGGSRGNGYGAICLPTGKRGGKIENVHRVAYELLVGPVPEGMVLDHKCRVRACWNPAHLEPVTHRENTLRGIGITARYARQTHCKHGHPFTPANTYSPRKGQRYCKRCAADRMAVYLRGKKAAK